MLRILLNDGHTGGDGRMHRERGASQASAFSTLVGVLAPARAAITDREQNLRFGGRRRQFRTESTVVCTWPARLLARQAAAKSAEGVFSGMLPDESGEVGEETISPEEAGACRERTRAAIAALHGGEPLLAPVQTGREPRLGEIADGILGSRASRRRLHAPLEMLPDESASRRELPSTTRDAVRDLRRRAQVLPCCFL